MDKGISFAIKGKKKESAKPLQSAAFAKESEKKKVDFITAVDDEGLVSKDPVKKEAPKIIPLVKQVQWREIDKDALAKLRGNKNGDVAGGGEADSGAAKPENEKKTEELSLDQQAVNALIEEASGEKKDGPQKVIPILMQNRVPGYDEALDDKEKYMLDMLRRPDESTQEDYDNMPVDSFGTAMLMGMGWKHGEAIGGCNKGLATPAVGIPRLPLLGLGATRDEDLVVNKRKPKKYIKPGESREKPKEMIALDADGNRKHMRNLDEKLVEREIVSIRVGAYVFIKGGNHSGLYGKIESIDTFKDKSKVRLALGSEIVHVYNDDLKAVPKAEFQSKSRKRIRTDDRDDKPSKKSSQDSYHKDTKAAKPWLDRHIRVRIISESYKKGKYYNKKVKIVDVVTPLVCNCENDNGRLLEGVKQKYLETVIPKELGSTVLIVAGKNRHQRGKLLQKDSKKAVAVVQIMGEPDAREFSYDDISEYLGPAYDEDW
eukprot:m.340556 g.340556  ORF g.340556 m.340556 type:complete len:487 (+) comp19376_c0_seq1:162-1622(+)